MAQQVHIFDKESNRIKIRVVLKHKEIFVIGYTTRSTRGFVGVWTKTLVGEGLPATRSPHSRVQATKQAHPFLYLTVRANKSWCVTNCQMDSLLQIPQREGGARLT